jgi:hypothetical protein
MNGAYKTSSLKLQASGKAQAPSSKSGCSFTGSELKDLRFPEACGLKFEHFL